MKQYLELLGVSSNASMDQVKKAYRTLIKQWHPDKFAQDVTGRRAAQEKTKAINVAFAAIKKQVQTFGTLASSAKNHLTQKDLYTQPSAEDVAAERKHAAERKLRKLLWQEFQARRAKRRAEGEARVRRANRIGGLIFLGVLACTLATVGFFAQQYLH